MTKVEMNRQIKEVAQKVINEMLADMFHNIMWELESPPKEVQNKIKCELLALHYLQKRINDSRRMLRADLRRLREGRWW